MINDIKNNLDIKNMVKSKNLHVNSVQLDKVIDNKKTLFSTTDELQRKEIIKFLNKIQQEIEKAQMISIKIIKNEKVTKEEMQLITENYPDLKKFAEESLNEINNLKTILKKVDTNEQKEHILVNHINKTKTMVREGEISEVQANIKLKVLEELDKFIKITKKDFNKLELIATKIVKGEILNKNEEKFINENYPELKRLTKRIVEDSIIIKESLKNYNTYEEKEKILLKLKDTIINNKINTRESEIETKLNIIAISNIEVSIKEEDTQLNKAVDILLKIIKSTKISKNESKFINEKYPKLKDFTEKALDEYEYLNKQVIKLMDSEKKQSIFLKEFNNIEDMLKNGHITEVQAKIKKEIIEEIKKDKERILQESNSKFYLNPYLYLNINNSNSKFSLTIIIIISIIYVFYN